LKENLKSSDLNIKAIEEVDKGDMLGILEGFPDQCHRALKLGETFSPPGEFDKVIVVGMGGSGVAGDLLKHFLKKPVFVVKEAKTPLFTDERTLLIAVSYSGNTIETISALEDGLAKGAKALCLSSGGRLGEIASKRDLPFIQIPGGIQPRLALGYLFLPLLVTMRQINNKDKELQEMIFILKKQAQKFKKGVSIQENPAKQLAQRLYQKVPLIWGVEGVTDVVAKRWKNQFNENSKQPAFWNSLPELLHNEVESFTLDRLQGHIILLRSHLDTEYTKQIELLKVIFKEKGVSFEEVWAEGMSKIAQVFSLIYLGDFVSAYLGVLNKVDPTPVEVIKHLKVK
jgi:glucose/mannose-6-phosphate isomerase